MIRAEVSYTLGGRRSSTDSNKISSGEVSPYDNNSPVLTDRLFVQRPDDLSTGSEKLYKVPEQYTLVGHLKSKSRDSSPVSWPEKGKVCTIMQFPPFETAITMALENALFVLEFGIVLASSI